MKEKLRLLQSLNFVDWLKIIVAIDITGVGIGLILGFPLHVFANIFGWVSRIFFGFLYIFTALLIFSKVLYAKNIFFKHDGVEGKKFRKGYEEDERFLKKILKRCLRCLRNGYNIINNFSQKIIDAIDSLLDRFEFFLKDKKEEIKEEVMKIIKDEKE